MDHSNLDFAALTRAEDDHANTLKIWLKVNGYTGPNTGKIIRFSVADGCASYMFADAKGQSCLIHLPYGDAYQYPDAEFLPRGEILRRIQQQKKLEKMTCKAN